MRTVIERARSVRGEAAVFTFEPHPRKLLYPDRAPRLLTTLEQKLELLDEIGVDLVIVEPFTRELATLPAERFVREVIFGRLEPVEVYVGYDFRYGKDRSGSMRTLTELGPHLGFAVTIIPEVTVESRDVNSTRSRELLGEGKVGEAAELLARPYRIRGVVVEGDRRGVSIGFPTINLAPENEILPARGVYAGHVRFLDDGDPSRESVHRMVTNVGRRPTFKEGDAIVAEAHLLEFDAQVYGKRAETTDNHPLPSHRRLPGGEACKTEIAADVESARKLLGHP